MAERAMRIRAPATIVFGVGALAEIAPILGELGATSPLVVTDPRVAAIGLPDRVRRDLLTTGFAAGVWHGIEPDPDEEHVERCSERIQAGGHDSVVAVGGGSVIDVAKVAAVLPTNGGRTAHYFGFDRVRRPGLPLVAVPTTAGSGAEVSSHAVIVRLRPRKKEVVGGVHLLARAAVIDPAASATLPPEQTIYTALDGLVHAIEAFLARRATGFTDRYAGEAVARISRSLPQILQSPHDDAAREELSLGCLYAGLAMANAGAGAIHALGYPLTSGYGIPHGIANALVAPAALERMSRGSPERQRQLCCLLGGDPKGGPAGGLANALRRLLASIGVREGLAEFGVPAADLARLADAASHFRPILENAPVALMPGDLQDIYEAAWRPPPPPSTVTPTRNRNLHLGAALAR